MAFLKNVLDYFSGPADSLGCATEVGAVGGFVGSDVSHTQGPDHDYCTASGSEPTWHNGFGTEADFTTLDAGGGFDDSFSSTSSWEM